MRVSDPLKTLIMKHSVVLWVLLRDFWLFLQILKHKNGPGACALFSSFIGIHKGLQQAWRKESRSLLVKHMSRCHRKTDNATKCTLQ